ncbi:hypothetical protein WH47_08277 [Habropoda laboriosa]|uniref:Uncharacterized protein n=1 Tax=Habropoda laboriosa TaxID=597456 RepID=A0A0L7RH37_9HYME|nr:hypothetical protein WH47_08277 [Habropoda laboriosa]
MEFDAQTIKREKETNGGRQCVMVRETQRRDLVKKKKEDVKSSETKNNNLESMVHNEEPQCEASGWTGASSRRSVYVMHETRGVRGEREMAVRDFDEISRKCLFWGILVLLPAFQENHFLREFHGSTCKEISRGMVDFRLDCWSMNYEGLVRALLSTQLHQAIFWEDGWDLVGVETGEASLEGSGEDRDTREMSMEDRGFPFHLQDCLFEKLSITLWLLLTCNCIFLY